MNNVLQDKAARRLLAAILFLFLLSILFDLADAWNHSQKIQELLLTQNRAVASSLLELGVSCLLYTSDAADE